MWLDYLAVFLAVGLADLCIELYRIAAEKRRLWLAPAWAALGCGASSLAIVMFVHQPKLIIAAVVATWLANMLMPAEEMIDEKNTDTEE